MCEKWPKKLSEREREEWLNKISMAIVDTCEKIRKEYTPEWLTWSINYLWLKGYFLSICRKWIGQAGVNTKMLKSTKIPLPPLEEQKRIVSRLEQLISKVEEAKRLRKLAREEAEKIMQAALNKVFSRAEKEGWKLGRLNDVADVKYGKAKPKETGNVPVVGSGGIYAYTNEALVNFPTIVIGRKGTAGEVWMMNTPCWPSDTTFYLKWKNSVGVEPHFIFWYLKFVKLSGEKGKTALPSLLRQDLENQPIHLPPIKEQQKIAAYLERISETVDSLKKLQQRTEEELEKLVPSILDKAFRGEL